MTVQTISIEMPVGQIVLEHPQTRSLFEKLRIDYACSGGQSLRQTAQNAGIEPESILLQLERTLSNHSAPASPVEGMSLPDLCCWLVSVHHARLKKQLPDLDCLLCRVRKTAQKPYTFMLKRLGDTYQSLAADLRLHLARQEQDLFCLIARLAAGSSGRLAVQPSRPDVENAIAAEMRLHSAAAAGLSALRDLTEDYSWLDRSNSDFKTLYRRLAAFENDLHEHIHYENNLLFPRTLRLFDVCE